jgi:hypothetical protein
MTWSGRRTLAVAAVLYAIEFVLAGAILFVFPRLGTPTHSDAIVVLAGNDEHGRLEEGYKLLLERVAPVLVISAPPNRVRVGPCDPSRRDRSVICFEPDPVTTQGEAELTSLLARELRWHSIVVVTTRFQATRAHLRMERCFPGSITSVGVTPPARQWPFDFAYETGAMFKAVFLQRHC